MTDEAAGQGERRGTIDSPDPCGPDQGRDAAASDGGATRADQERHTAVPPPGSPARERVLAAAARLFAERGYAAVTLRDIAGDLGIRQASLYHHVPGGKDELFLEVMERGLARHRAGLATALDADEPGLRAQLKGAARWLLSQPPLDLGRLSRADLPALGGDHAARLEAACYAALLAPLAGALIAATERGEVRLPHPTLVAGTFLSIIDGIANARRYFAPAPAEAMADAMVDVLLDGLRPRSEGNAWGQGTGSDGESAGTVGENDCVLNEERGAW